MNFKITLETVKALQPILTGKVSFVPVKSLPSGREEVEEIAKQMGLSIARNGRYGLNVYRHHSPPFGAA